MDESLTCLVYETHYSHLLRVEALNPAFAFPFEFSLMVIKPTIRRVIKRIITLHPQWKRPEFMGRHYTTVAQVVINSHSHRFYSQR